MCSDSATVYACGSFIVRALGAETRMYKLAWKLAFMHKRRRRQFFVLYFCFLSDVIVVYEFHLSLLLFRYDVMYTDVDQDRYVFVGGGSSSSSSSSSSRRKPFANSATRRSAADNNSTGEALATFTTKSQLRRQRVQLVYSSNILTQRRDWRSDVAAQQFAAGDDDANLNRSAAAGANYRL
jgi:hypothetical protein